MGYLSAAVCCLGALIGSPVLKATSVYRLSQCKGVPLHQWTVLLGTVVCCLSAFTGCDNAPSATARAVWCISGLCGVLDAVSVCCVVHQCAVWCISGLCGVVDGASVDSVPGCFTGC